MNERSEAGGLAGAPIAKMNGIGNAIVVLDLRGRAGIVSAAEARAIAAAPGLAFDQLMAIHDPVRPGTDADLRIYNTDGSSSGACGNGTRCVAWFLLRDDERDSLVLTAGSALLACRRSGTAAFSVDLGVPRFTWDRIPLRDASVDPRALRIGPPNLGPAFAVNVGNPHAVFFVEDVEAIDLAAVGPPIETSPLFPERVNVSFAQVIDRVTIKLRVWERGAGATLGCGTGACATLIAAASMGHTGRHAHVDLPGGRLAIDWREDGHVVMSGPVELEFEAQLGPDLLVDRAA